MKKRNLIIASALLSVGSIGCGVVASAANDSSPPKPAWITAENKLDLGKLPDSAKIPHHCWSGKLITMDGKSFKAKISKPPTPGTQEHKLALAKSQELHKVPGAAVVNNEGKEQLVIDERNPEVQRIMKEYEAKEIPQCR